LCDRVLNPPIVDSSKYATAATATVAYITDSIHYIAYRMNQSNLLRLVKKGQDLLLGDIVRAWRLFSRREDEAGSNWKVTSTAYVILLLSTNAIVQAKALRREEDCADIIIR